MLVLTACGGAKQGNDDAQSETDTTATAAAEAPKQADVVLPDTMYESARSVDFKTTIIDETTPGTLQSTADLYADTPGAFTFRKGSHRDADFGGRVSGTPTEVTVDWAFTTDSDRGSERYGTWGGGSGWTGQPLFVNWPDSCMAQFRAEEASTLTADFGAREIIVGSLAGKVYFINFDTGKASRKSVDVTNPIKGTVSLDPTLNGNLYVGQGIPQSRPFGALTVNLYKGAVTHTFGEDPKARRQWGAYDSSPVRVDRFLFRPGENGTLYKWLVKPDGSVTLHSTMTYSVGGRAPGMEASMSVYGNYGFTADNMGNVLGVNLNTMKPVWHYDLGDDTDCSLTMLVEDGKPYIYVGSEVDKQNVGTANFVKLDAATGKKVWETKVPGRLAEVGKKHFDGGFYATALPGAGNCSDLILANCVLNERGQNGVFMAMKRSTGEIVYSTPLKYYAWSSPVGFLNEKDEMTVFTADCSGNVYLINPRDGKIIFTTHVGNNFESSPVVVGSSVVVGSRGDKIFKMTLK